MGRTPEASLKMMSYLAISFLLITTSSCSPLTSVPGIPGQDYPTLDFFNLPSTSFDCNDRVNGGLYADEEAFCQMYHMCVTATDGGFKKFSFLCPNGTMFDQDKLACNTWFNVECNQDAIDIAVADLDLLDAERTFITLGLNADNPEEDHPWRFRKQLF